MHTYKRDDRLSVWIQAALGLAGLIVTIIAAIAFTRADDAPRSARPVESQRRPTPTEPVTYVRPRSAADEAARRQQLADIQRQREEIRHAGQKAADLRMRSKCIDGTLFAEVDGALTNVGTCSKRHY